MRVGKYIFDNWSTPIRDEYFWERKVSYKGHAFPLCAVQIYLSYNVHPGKFMVNRTEFPYSEEYFRLYGRIPFDDLESAKAHVDEFLIRMEKLNIFI